MTETHTYVTAGTVICNDSDPIWLHERSKRITGSMVAPIMGLSPWKTRSDLLASVQKEDKEEFLPNKNMWWGSFCEKSNIDAYSVITGMDVLPDNTFFGSTEHPILGATIDGFCWHSECPPMDPPPIGAKKHWELFLRDIGELEGVGLLEAKQTARIKGDGYNWTDAPPMYYLCQVQHQLLVTGLPWAIIFARIGASDMRMHVVKADKQFHADIIEECTEFAQEAGVYDC